ncbi:MAG: hypothetical protein LBS57_00830 [Treponema sp.]|nr:hypothetical protein [Treponema sp.]
MKKFFLLPVVLIVLLSGCPVDSDSGGRQTSFGLEGTVWAASRAADQDDWLTLAFRAESENPRHGRDAVLAFASDSDAPEFSHVSAAAEYSYDEGTRAGSVTGIGDFSVDGEGKIIRFGDFKSEGPQELKRLYPDAGNVFTLITPLPADLAKTVWASGGLRSNDWVTLAFRDSQFVAVSHMADNTQWPRGYTYNDAEKKGSIDYLGYRDGGFSVNGDTLRIANFYGHGGAVDFQRVR